MQLTRVSKIDSKLFFLHEIEICKSGHQTQSQSGFIFWIVHKLKCNSQSNITFHYLHSTTIKVNQVNRENQNWPSFSHRKQQM